MDSDDLSQAFNAAQSSALDQGLLMRLNQKYAGVEARAVFTCMPDRGFYIFPDALLATGALKEVLNV